MILNIFNRLKATGIQFAAGLSESECDNIEEIYNIKLPESLREFYGYGVPFSDEDVFPKWFDCSDANIAGIQERIQAPINRLLKPVKDGYWLKKWGVRPDSPEEVITRFNEIAVKAPRLIPIYSHRYMPMLNNVPDPPVISAVGRDIIYYGSDLQNYLLNEFLNEDFIIPKNRAYIPFWSDIINRDII